MKKVLVILGSTATGKTALALFLAKKFNGELISCDSRQVYIGLDIGTGKLPSSKLKVLSAKLKKGEKFWEIDGIKVWMYDVVSPKFQYTVAEFVKDASSVIKDIQKKGKLPIVVGGTGFYLKALLNGLPNLSVPVDFDLRKKLESLNKEQLQKKLEEVSSKKWKSLNVSDRENPRRLVRAIELAISNHDENPSTISVPFDDTLKIGLTALREILYKRVDEHVLSRIKQGMIKEAESLRKYGLSLKRMRQLGLEYGVLADYLEGKIQTKENLIKILQGKIHGYLRRQQTWFKKEENVNWFDITNQTFVKQVENLINRWYHSPDAAKN